jgi:hypothetical protein
MLILGTNAGRIIELAEKAMEELAKLGEQKSSGYLTVFDAAGGGEIILISRIGICPPEKAKKYLTLSLEKSGRLFSQPLHYASFQSRNPAEDKWGGAITAGSIIISFSGLSEMADEALSVYVAWNMGLIDNKMVSFFTAISDNKYLQQICHQKS